MAGKDSAVKKYVIRLSAEKRDQLNDLIRFRQRLLHQFQQALGLSDCQRSIYSFGLSRPMVTKLQWLRSGLFGSQVMPATVSASKPSKIAVRQINDTDIPAAQNFLARGYDRPLRFWEHVFACLSRRSVPAGNFRGTDTLSKAMAKLVGIMLSDIFDYLGKRRKPGSDATGPACT